MVISCLLSDSITELANSSQPLCLPLMLPLYNFHLSFQHLASTSLITLINRRSVIAKCQLTKTNRARNTQQKNGCSEGTFQEDLRLKCHHRGEGEGGGGY